MKNPFRETNAADPWQSVSEDLDRIQPEAFQLCCRAFDQVLEQRRSTSVLIYGEAGSGKTRLLGRVRRHLRSAAGLHMFAAVQLQTNPNRFWRHLRESLIDCLLRPVKDGRGQLETVFLYRLQLLRQTRPQSKKPYEHLSELVEELAARADLSSHLCRVLETLVRRRHRGPAAAWLRGSALTAEDLGRIGLPSDRREDRDPETAARDRILEICRLAGPRIPVVLALDRVEALQRDRNDTRAVYVFGQAAGFLHDETDNLLLITCVQSFFHDYLKQARFKSDAHNVLMAADYDRLAAHRAKLLPLDLQGAMELARSRLRGANDGDDSDQDGLLTALREELESFIGAGAVTARSILYRCAAVYDGWCCRNRAHRPETQTTGDDEFLQQEEARRVEEALMHLAAGDCDVLLSDALPVAIHLWNADWAERDQGRPRDVDMVIEGPAGMTGISLCSRFAAAGLAARLRRLRALMSEGRLERLVLIRHPDLPIGPDAGQTRADLGELQDLPVMFVHPAPAVLATLATLRGLLADSRSGDLVNGEKAVGEGAVRVWGREHLGWAVQGFIEAVMAVPKPFSTRNFLQLQDLLSLMQHEPVVRLDAAAESLDIGVDDLRRMVGRHNRFFGFLPGPPELVFQYAAARAA